MSKITHEVTRSLAVLSVSGTYEKQVNLISWNGADPVIDIRTWDTETGHAYKGVTIREDEVPALIDALMQLQASPYDV